MSLYYIGDTKMTTFYPVHLRLLRISRAFVGVAFLSIPPPAGIA